MSVILATKEQVQEYYQSDALGQSKLKKLLGDVSSFNKEDDFKQEHFIIGSAVDTILTDSEEKFKEEYYISEVEKLPSEAVIDIIKLVQQDLLEDYAESLEVVPSDGTPSTTGTFEEFAGELANHSQYILDACEKTGWQPRWGAEAKLNNIVGPGAAYFNDLIKSFGKTILSQTQANTIHSIVASLRTHYRTSSYFNRELLEGLNDVQVFYQFPIYFTYRGVSCKALLDIVILEFDSDTRKLLKITPIDLKTMNGNTYYFPSSVRTRRYDIQAAWYTLALMHHFAEAITEGANIMPFQFIVESTSYQGKPLRFVCDNSLLNMGENGRKRVSLIDMNIFAPEGKETENITLQYEVLGYEQLLDLYLFHSENGFSEERKIQEAGINPLTLTWDGID
jgi:hypothetical protein